MSEGGPRVLIIGTIASKKRQDTRRKRRSKESSRHAILPTCIGRVYPLMDFAWINTCSSLTCSPQDITPLPGCRAACMPARTACRPKITCQRMCSECTCFSFPAGLYISLPNFRNRAIKTRSGVPKRSATALAPPVFVLVHIHHPSLAPFLRRMTFRHTALRKQA